MTLMRSIKLKHSQKGTVFVGAIPPKIPSKKIRSLTQTISFGPKSAALLQKASLSFGTMGVGAKHAAKAIYDILASERDLPCKVDVHLGHGVDLVCVIAGPERLKVSEIYSYATNKRNEALNGIGINTSKPKLRKRLIDPRRDRRRQSKSLSLPAHEDAVDSKKTRTGAKR